MFFLKDKIKYKNLISKCFENIDDDYIDKIINNKDIKLLLFCNDYIFNENKIVGMILFVKIIFEKEDNYYISLFGIFDEYKNYGYGNHLMNEFKLCIKKSKSKNKKNIIIYTLKNSIHFYLKNDFTKIMNEKYIYYIQKFEDNFNLEKKLFLIYFI